MLILTIIMMDLLTGMEFDLFVPSFPELKEYFHLSASFVELSLSVNFVAYCISLFIVGSLADRYGRKPIIILGLIFFIAGSLFCLSTTSYTHILGGRFLQGLGIAAPAILSFLIIADNYSIKSQQYLMSMLNASMNTAVAFSPVIGSYITKYFHWRGNFSALLLLGILTLLMTCAFVPSSEKKSKQSNEVTPEYSAIFKSNLVVLLMINFIVTSVPYWIFVGISPLLYMHGLGVSLSHFGFYQGSLALAFAVGCLLSGFVLHRFNQKKLVSLSNFIYLLSFVTVLLITIDNSHNPLLITLAILPFVIGQIMPSNILYPLYLNLLPEAKGKLSAILQSGRLILSSLSLQIAGYYYEGSIQNIGIILSVFIFVGIVTTQLVINKWVLIKTPEKT